jgi:hypothetical protein
VLDSPDRDVGAPTAAARDCDPEARLVLQGGDAAAEDAAFLAPEAMARAGGTDAVDACLGARSGAQAAMQAAAAVFHRRLTAGEAASRAGAAARGEGRIATWRPILQSAAPLGMGFYHRQHLWADFGGCAGRSWRWSSSRSRKRNWVDIRAALPVSLLVMSENWAGCAARRKAASAA